MKQLIKKILISGQIETLTGLHIGGSNTALQIGGIDLSVVRNPVNNKPYIPGSSLKGKMRCLTEQALGVCGREVGKEVPNGPSDETSGPKAQPVLNLFGLASRDKKIENIPSRIIVRDCELNDPDDKLLQNRSMDLPYTEAKTEVVIDRVKASATPRQIERVPAGVFFNMEMVLNVFQGDKETEMLELLFNAMRLVQDDYLGGKGSRGCGQVRFHIRSIVERPQEYYVGNKTDVQECSIEIPADLKADQKAKP